MIQDAKSQKTGKIYPILLFLFLAVVFFANLYKAHAIGSSALDLAPVSTFESVEPIEQPEKSSPALATSFSSQSTQSSYVQTTTVSTQSTPTFAVTKYIGSCSSSSCLTSVDAEYGVVQYKSKFFYGHSTRAFGVLKNVYVGDRISIVDADGITRNLVVTARIVEQKSTLNSNRQFRSDLYNAKYGGVQYSASFMTCGNGQNDDSNYRLILFASAV
ncbi:hypothetical protein IJF86_01740 [Candidatus Saccharibacteria bacterium]|nr:hypothetical protein [Candidatus Saccharibacteria bacterium]